MSIRDPHLTTFKGKLNSDASFDANTRELLPSSGYNILVIRPTVLGTNMGIYVMCSLRWVPML